METQKDTWQCNALEISPKWCSNLQSQQDHPTYRWIGTLYLSSFKSYCASTDCRLESTGTHSICPSNALLKSALLRLWKCMPLRTHNYKWCCNSETPTNHPCTSMYVSTSFLRELSWPSEVIRSFSSLMVIRYLAWKAVACAFGLQKTSKKTPSSVWRYSMLFHRCGLPACSFSLKVVKRPDMAELNPLADSSENGMVRDVSPMWKVIGVLAATISTKTKPEYK